MDAPQQIAHSVLKGRVATRTPPPTCRTEIRHCRVTEHAPTAVHARERGLLMYCLKKIADRVLGRGHARLHTVLGGTPLAQVQQLDLAPFDSSELDDRVALSAAVAQHQASTSRTPDSV